MLPLPARLRPRLTLIPRDGVQHDFVRQLRRVDAVPLTPIIAHTIRENIALPTEVRRGDGSAHLRVPFQSMFGVLVPEMERPVRAGGAEGAVLRVEGDGVDGVDVCVAAAPDARLSGAVAFEGEVRRSVFLLDVLDGASTLHAADGEAAAVVEAGDDSRLPFQGRLHGFVEFGWVVEVDDVDVAVCGRDDEEGVDDVHAVDAFLAGDGGDGGGLAEIPVLDGFVPGAGDEHLGVLLGDVDETGAADGSIVRGDLLGGGGVAGREIHHAGCFVGASSNNFGAVLKHLLAVNCLATGRVKGEEILLTSSNSEQAAHARTVLSLRCLPRH